MTARDDGTRLTRTLSGRYARGIVNEFMEQLRPFESAIPCCPIQNALTTIVSRDVILKADAELRGKGGKVVVWADNATHFTLRQRELKRLNLYAVHKPERTLEKKPVTVQSPNHFGAPAGADCGGNVTDSSQARAK